MIGSLDVEINVLWLNFCFGGAAFVFARGFFNYLVICWVFVPYGRIICCHFVFIVSL